MKNIVLTGFMGTGKSTVGRIVAKKLGRRFIDIDSEIIKSEGKKISEIFEENGEQYFREAERRAVERISRMSGCVIATGGGTVTDKDNVCNLRKNGIIVYLASDADTIMERTHNSDTRPLLRGAEKDDVQKLLDERLLSYLDNDFSVSIQGESPLMLAEKIIKYSKSFL